MAEQVILKAQRKPAVELGLSAALLIGVLALIYGAFLFMRDSGAAKALIVIVALSVGIGAVWVLFYLANRFIEALPQRIGPRLRPLVFVGPAVVILLIYIIFPAIRTMWLSLFNRTSEMFIGLENYRYIFTDSNMLVVLRNTLLWVLLAPTLSVGLGLLLAVLLDRIAAGGERVIKSLVFLPLAISFVGASVIWRFVYYYQPPGASQIGLLNALTTLFGSDPKAWLTQIPWKQIGAPWLNNLFLIFIMIWLQTGFALVILSAAVKGVPHDLLEAARIDGAGEVRILFRVTIPWISGTLLTVSTAILFNVLKIFDVVFAVTSGNFDTDVVASRMYFEAFKFRDFGRGSALAVFLFIVVIPFIIHNIRQLRSDRA